MRAPTEFHDALLLLRHRNYVGGELVEAGPDRLDVTRPSDRTNYAGIPDSDETAVDVAVANAHSAWVNSDWRRRAPRERIRVLRKFAHLIEADAALPWLEAVGSTRPITEVTGHDVPFTAEGIRFFSEWADKLGGEVAATQSSQFGFVLSEPYGVVAAIAPWNFPLSTASWKAGAALAAGNAVVLKPSELTPFSSMRLAQLALEAGLPPGVFNVVNGSGAKTGRALVRHPLVGKVTFTGSTATGAAIMADAALSGPKPVTLELGGKSPQLVFADADLDLAAGCIARSVLGNAGQVCVAGTRLIVDQRVADDLSARVVALMRQVAPGPTWERSSTFSPIVSEKQMQRIANLVGSAAADGAEVLTGGAVLGSGDDAFYAPTVLTGLSAGALAIEEEIFGPVLTIQTFSTEAEGIALADHPRYGLAAGIYTRDLSRALRAMRAIQAGTVWINRYGRTYDFAIPTGGYKGSGFGKDLGRQAVEANLRQKSVLMAVAASDA